MYGDAWFDVSGSSYYNYFFFISFRIVNPFRRHARSSSCILTGLQADETSRLIPCGTCPRMFHPTVVVPTTYNTAAGPHLFPDAVKPVGDGTWQCSSCSKQGASAGAGAKADAAGKGRAHHDGGSGAAAAAAVATAPESDADPATVLKQATTLLAKLPAVHR